jgi:hypothetical protein
MQFLDAHDFASDYIRAPTVQPKQKPRRQLAGNIVAPGHFS